MQVNNHIWMKSLISPALGRNGLQNCILSYREMWECSYLSIPLRTEGTTNSSSSLFSARVSDSILHTFCLCSSNRACPYSLTSAFISYRCAKLRRRIGGTHLGAARIQSETIKFCKCKEDNLSWVRRNSAVTLLFSHPAHSHYSLNSQLHEILLVLSSLTSKVKFLRIVVYVPLSQPDSKDKPHKLCSHCLQIQRPSLPSLTPA